MSYRDEVINEWKLFKETWITRFNEAVEGSPAEDVLQRSRDFAIILLECFLSGRDPESYVKGFLKAVILEGVENFIFEDARSKFSSDMLSGTKDGKPWMPN